MRVKLQRTSTCGTKWILDALAYLRYWEFDPTADITVQELARCMHFLHKEVMLVPRWRTMADNLEALGFVKVMNNRPRLTTSGILAIVAERALPRKSWWVNSTDYQLADHIIALVGKTTKRLLSVVHQSMLIDDDDAEDLKHASKDDVYRVVFWLEQEGFLVVRNKQFLPGGSTLKLTSHGLILYLAHRPKLRYFRDMEQDILRKRSERRIARKERIGGRSAQSGNQSGRRHKSHQR